MRTYSVISSSIQSKRRKFKTWTKSIPGSEGELALLRRRMDDLDSDVSAHSGEPEITPYTHKCVLDFHGALVGLVTVGREIGRAHV